VEAEDGVEVRAVIFDMDGVIVDSEPYSMQALVDTLRHYGVDPTADELRRSYGRRITDDFADYFGRAGVAVDLETAVARKRARYFELAAGRLEPFPGVLSLFPRARAKGYRLALASSGDRDKVAFSMRALGLDGIFEIVVTGDDIAHSKPHPEIYLTAAGRLEVDPGHCLAIEDAPNGVQAAKRAGMRCIAVTNSVTREELAGADLVVASLADDLSALLPL
jgi:HAD superfamily hydrolase (TIGR01509 family)